MTKKYETENNDEELLTRKRNKWASKETPSALGGFSG
jgi:hypothetical protein